MSASHRLLTLAAAMALTSLGGFSGQAAATATNLSTTPPDLTTSVAPNIAVTFDDSGSMQSYYMGDNRPFDQGGWSTTSPWMCAGVIDPRVKDTKNNLSKAMNGVYYNPNITYTTAVNANGTPMPNADATLKKVWLNGIDVNRPDNKQTPGTAAFVGDVNSLATYLDSRVSNMTGTIYTVDSKGKVTQNDRWICTANATNPFTGSLKDPDTGATPTGGPYYYRYKSTAPSFTNTDGTINTGILYTTANWEAVSVPASQYQNFANWYAYYRTRNMMTRTALSQAFSKIGNSVRIAWQNMANANGNSQDGALADADYDTKFGTTAVLQDIGDLNSTVRASFYRWMLQVVGGNSTPARAATIRAGNVFRQALAQDKTDPYWNGLTGSDSADLVCRKNFHMLVTDGYWNEGDPSAPAKVNGTPALTSTNTAQASQTLPDGRSYSPTAAVSVLYGNVAGDAYTTSMANIAWFYWATDLQPKLDNGVKPYWKDLTSATTVVLTDPGKNDDIYWNSVNDPATWQHVAQFFVTLGVAGTLDYPGDYAALKAGSKAWPLPVNNAPQGVDDTWHAALNSRGGFFSASDPATLVSSLVNIINSVIATSSSAVSPALSDGVLGPNALTYVPNFSSVDWSGTLKEYPLTSTGGRGTEDWDAAQGLLHRTDRYVVTSAGPGEGKGVQFLYTSLTASQKQIMDSGDGSGTPESSDGKGTNRVDWVRGIQTDEGSLLRTRSSVLGAVVNAQPVYVAYPSSGYRDYFPPNPGTPGTPSPETAAYSGSTPDPTKSYSGFVAANLKRMPTLYVAANDGMLHAFDAQSKAQSPTAGSELWAYVPDAAYRKLWFFSQKDNFKYRPTVDATPIYRDVYFSSSSKSTVGWHTILVGGLRYGGRGIYALDITSSGTTNAAGAAAKVLWEFNANSLDGTTKVGANLGYTFGQPNIGRLSNGKWVVLVPAGYFPTDSTDPEYGAAAASATNSSLFILDAQTGALIKELKTPTSYGGVTITSYGLSSPVLGDYDNDQIDDVAFAGDLVGNLWRFNLKDLNTVDLVFSPKVSAAQPITVMPRLFPDPTSQNFIVVFGTGKFIGDDDRTSTGAVTQSVYGIRDLGQTNKTGLPWTVDKLVAQTLNQTSAGLRGLTSNPAPTTSKPGGWYFDLVSAGEKVVVTPTALFNTNQAIITTLIPTTPDPCNPGRAGALMVIDSSTGGAGAGVSGGSYTSGSQKFTVAGAKVDNPPATGGLPAATGLGGGSVIVPGVTVTGSGAAFSVGSPIWRRRSWRILNDQ